MLVPLVIADLMRGSGHFNFAQGVVGAAVGIGASFSTTLAGYIFDQAGPVAAFLFLAGIAGSFLLPPSCRKLGRSRSSPDLRVGCLAAA